MAISVTTLGLAAGAAAFGAWPVLPFAGAEVLLVWLAFHILRRHDGDFERLEIDAGEVRWVSRNAARETRFVGHLPWTRVVVEERGRVCSLELRYQGRAVPLGRLLSDEGRRRLAEVLKERLRATAN